MSDTRSDQVRTRHVSPEELALALAPFAPRAARKGARAEREAHGAAAQARPAVQFTPPRSVARASVPRALTRSREVDARLSPRARGRRLQAWQAWMLVLVLAGFSLGGLFAIVTQRAQPSAPDSAFAATPKQLPLLSASAQEESVGGGVELEMPPAPLLFDNLAAGGARADRRHAVDALFAGRTRVALERYQRLLASQRGLTDADAIDRVVTLLARELRACEQEAGTPCGL
ncbi:MAG TPA: hypothetical protein VI299_02725 [Polyangiales bacterium]